MVLIESSPKKIYIRVDEQGWQPGVNTVAYYPLKSDILDHSGNNNDFTGGAYTFSDNKIIVTSKLTGPLVVPADGTTGTRTIVTRIGYQNSASNGAYSYASGWAGVNGENRNSNSIVGTHLKVSYSWYEVQTSATQNFDCVITIKNGNKLTCYINGVLLNETTLSGSTRGTDYPTTESALNPGTYGEIIIEDKARTAQEISDYYDITKGNYGL